MGTISSQIQSEDPENEGHSHTVQTELKIDFTKDVNPNLKQLLYCMRLKKESRIKKNSYYRVFSRN